MTDPIALLQKAEELSHSLRERSDEIEAARRIPADISQQIASAGFYRLGAPKSLGGLEASPDTSSRIFEILAQGDASCAWVTFIGATSGTALADIPQTAAAQIFAKPDSLITGVFAPTGIAQQVENGFRVSGRWQWGSGSQNAAWVLGGCILHSTQGKPLLDANKVPRFHMMLMPQAAVEFIDTWHVSGLRGTGSLDYQVENLFVPAEHVVGLFDNENRTYRTDKSGSSPLYSFPYFTFLALGIGAVCLGIARAAISDLLALASAKKPAPGRKTVAEQQVSQIKMAQAEADLRSARAFYYEALDDAWQSVLSGEAVSVEQRRNLRLATTNAVTKATEVVAVMYQLGGGSAVYEHSRLQRHFRDINVAASHIMVSPATLETAGRLFFGLDTNVERF